MNSYIYSIYTPKDFNKEKNTRHHILYYTDENVWIVPKAFNRTCINPRIFYSLKKKLNIGPITILDKTNPEMKWCYIAGHINRSGYNFLIANTPLRELPVFPDMSNVYNKIEGLRPIVVHTVGPDRFNYVGGSKIIVSESVGLVSPLWHYIKTKVYACTYIETPPFI